MAITTRPRSRHRVPQRKRKYERPLYNCVGANVVRFANRTLIERTEPWDLPPEFESLSDLVSEQPAEVCELFRYALVLAVIDDKKARVIGTRAENSQEWLTIKTIAGEVFEIMRPPISEEVEAELMSQVRAIIADEDDDVSCGAFPTVA